METLLLTGVDADEDEEDDPFTVVVGLGSVATARIRRERLRRGVLETKERREEKENRVG